MLNLLNSVGTIPNNKSSTSGATITVPIDYYVVLLAGQSNMVGRDTPVDGVLDATNASIFQYGNDGDAIVLASDPLDHVDETADTVGLGLSFAKQLLPTLPAGAKILLVPVADGGTAFGTGYWRSGGTGYDNAIAQVNAAMAACENPKLHSILWHQGESDMSMTEVQYAADLDLLIAGWRSAITGATSTTPFIAGEVPSWSGQYGAGVAAALLDTPDRITNTAHVATSDLTDKGDSLHFDTASTRTLGGRYFTAIASAMANVPAIPDTITDLAGASGNAQVVLTWTAPEDNHSTITDYTVEYKETSSGTWLTFTDGVSATTGATVTGLTNATSYDFRVSAVNGIGTSAVSNTAVETPSDVWDASTYAGYEEDFDADDLSTGAVASWAGKNTRTISQATSANQPTCNASEFNGHNGVYFDGTDDYLHGTPFIHGLGSHTIYMVMKAPNSGGEKHFLTEANTTTNTPTYNYIMQFNGLKQFYRLDDGSKPIEDLSSSYTFDNTTVILRFEDTGSEVKLYIDNVLLLTKAYTRGAVTLNALSIGALLRTSVVAHAEMTVARWLTYSGVHSGAVSSDIEGELSSLYV